MSNLPFRLPHKAFVDMRDYGLSAGGSYNSTQFKPAFDAAALVAQSSGLPLVVPQMAYSASTAIDVPAGVVVRFSDSFVCTRTANINVFRQIGTTSASAINLTDSVNNDGSGSPVMFVNTPSQLQQLRHSVGALAAIGGVSVGDWVAVVCNTQVTTFKSPNDGRYGTMRRVRSVSGDNLNIDTLVRPMFTATVARTVKLNLVQGCTLAGGQFTDSVAMQSTANLEPYFLFYLTDSPTIKNAKIFYLGGKAIDFNWTYNGQALKCNIRDLPSDEAGDQYGYGVLTSGGSLHGRMNGCSLTRTRHGFTTDRNFRSGLLQLHGEPEGFEVTGNTIQANYNTSLDTHEEGHQILFANNQIQGGRTGINLRSKGCSVTDNMISGTVDYGIAVQVFGYDATISGNTVKKVNKEATLSYGGIGIYAGARCNILNNVVSNNRLTDICLGDTGTSDGVGQFDAKVIGNSVGSAIGIHVDQLWSRATLQNNTGNCASTFILEAAGVTETNLINNVPTGAGLYSLLGSNRTQLGNKKLVDARPVDGTTQTLATAGTSIAPNGNTVLFNSATPVTLTATPTIDPGIEGQMLTLVNNGATDITFQDNESFAGSGLALPEVNFKLVAGCASRWVFLSGVWRLVTSGASNSAPSAAPVRVTSATTLIPGNYELSSTSGPFTITLSPGAGKWQFYNADLSSQTNAITIVAAGTPTFTDALGAQSQPNYTLNVGGTETTINNAAGGSVYYVTVTGRPSAGGSSTLGEFGSAILDAQVFNTASFVSSTNGTYVIPSAGTWRLRYDIFVDGSGVTPSASMFTIATSGGVVVPGTERARSGSSTAAESISAEAIVTTTGPATYSFRGRSVPSGNASIINGANGQSTISWEKVSGFLPVTDPTDLVAQIAHGLVLGQPVRVSSSGAYVAANANSQANLAGLLGVVSQVVDANSFRVAKMGQQVSGLTGLTPGSTYFVPVSGSGLVATAPTTPNFVAPIAVATSATSVNVGAFIYQAGA